jgi:hypothetical protein
VISERGEEQGCRRSEHERLHPFPTIGSSVYVVEEASAEVNISTNEWCGVELEGGVHHHDTTRNRNLS